MLTNKKRQRYLNPCESYWTQWQYHRRASTRNEIEGALWQLVRDYTFFPQNQYSTFQIFHCGVHFIWPFRNKSQGWGGATFKARGICTVLKHLETPTNVGRRGILCLISKNSNVHIESKKSKPEKETPKSHCLTSPWLHGATPVFLLQCLNFPKFAFEC